MNTHDILHTAALFNAQHDYSLDAVLKFVEIAARHAHTVQLARKEQADPQLVLPLNAQEVLP
jgi:hypothetical protein